MLGSNDCKVSLKVLKQFLRVCMLRKQLKRLLHIDETLLKLSPFVK